MVYETKFIFTNGEFQFITNCLNKQKFCLELFKSTLKILLSTKKRKTKNKEVRQ